MGKKGSYFAKHQEREGVSPEERERRPAIVISKEKQDLFSEGQLVLIDKPLHWTSFDVVKKIRNAIRIKKVGHAGTLDPLASGLLIICTGKFTKKINEFMAAEKEYTGSFTLGATTATYDLESTPEHFLPVDHLSENNVKEATKAFTGDIMQKPPIYSALKKDGVALYELARRGTDIELEPRPVKISVFEITAIQLPVVEFRVVCSTGTYIRSLAHDFGQTLGCGAYLSALRRTRIGEIDVKDATTVDAFLEALQT
jgi:tRNA pseudouridine55 synthase